MKTLFNKILFSYEIFVHENIFDFITDCLGDNWHEILNNSSEKLFIDDEIEEDSKNISTDFKLYCSPTNITKSSVKNDT